MRWENALVSLKRRQGWNEQSSLLLSEVSEKSSDESLVRFVIRVTFLFLNSFHTLDFDLNCRRNTNETYAFRRTPGSLAAT